MLRRQLRSSIPVAFTFDLLRISGPGQHRCLIRTGNDEKRHYSSAPMPRKDSLYRSNDDSSKTTATPVPENGAIPLKPDQKSDFVITKYMYGTNESMHPHNLPQRPLPVPTSMVDLPQQTPPASTQPPRRSRRLRKREALDHISRGWTDPPKEENKQARPLPASTDPFLEADHEEKVKPPATPIPTPEYLSQATEPPLDLDFIQPLLVILDLNGTLLLRKKGRKTLTYTRRPALNHFLERLTARHLVMVWSSARNDTVQKICKDIFSATQYRKLVAIWSREQLGLTPAQYKSKVQVYKRLEKVWEDAKIQASFPGNKDRAGAPLHHVLKYHPDTAIEKEMTGARELRWDQSNTILIDDSLVKAAGNPYNILEIPEFTNEPDEGDEMVLRSALVRIKMLAKTNDVSRRLHAWGEEGIKLDRDEIISAAESETESIASSGQCKEPGLSRRQSLDGLSPEQAVIEKVRRVARKKAMLVNRREEKAKKKKIKNWPRKTDPKAAATKSSTPPQDSASQDSILKTREEGQGTV
ncbi:NLI interacting factor-like phosphatase-domain-containing protein [Talaromyces proteolyticus]|uniref:Mitochondrial import inner membrane translocase subunit TIM50 n=1 Tax=Talaromyces proteolyticus TaxID=1131652 RepID=A0AAD4PU34_9EURO|nr:NLI interacting factor-like phosphatase-domain-containing protein [Talaromyces proteolyticus]KAH8689626.1 NLI interacting factor-like phosphatase-domain-containing protein [Talaromyces proteolyticus]